MKYFNSENSDRGVIAVAVNANVVTLTGATGTANITVDGVAYLATFATSLTVTAANWVALHRSALLLRGIRASSSAAVITLTHKRAHIVTNRATATIANVSGDLNGTLGATFTPDFNTARVYKLAIGAALTMINPVNLVDGAPVRLELTAGGTYAVTYGDDYQFPGGVEHTQTASGLDILEGAYNKTAGKLYLTVEASDVKA
jgi:hypothetical protein